MDGGEWRILSDTHNPPAGRHGSSHPRSAAPAASLQRRSDSAVAARLAGPPSRDGSYGSGEGRLPAHKNTARYPSGGPSGAERGSREPGGAIRTGIIAASIIFHQETSDVSPDLMVDAEGTRRYLRPCGFTEAQIDEIIADALADEASAGVVTPARTSARNVREHVVTPLIIPTPKERTCSKCRRNSGWATHTARERQTNQSQPATKTPPSKTPSRYVPPRRAMRRLGAYALFQALPRAQSLALRRRKF
jgi:hypothetical protein